MSNKVQQIIEIITKGAKKSEKEVKGVSGGLNDLAKSAAKAAGAYFGARALLDGVQKSVNLFAQQELAEKKLRFAAGASTDQLIKQAKALQQSTRFGDEAIIAQQAYVKSLGISTIQTKEIIAASVDLAAAMGISLESAVMNTTKTLSGMQGELGEKLPAAFKELTAEQLKAGEGIEFIREQFRGTAEEETDTLTGALDQMKNAFCDLGETVGEKLAPDIIALAKSFKDLISLDPSEEAEKEKNKFVELTEVLKDVNVSNSTRQSVIKTLKTEYVDYLGDLDLEKATLEDINKLQEDQVKQMEDRITQMIVAENLQEITEKIKRAELKLVEQELFAKKDLSDMDAGFNKTRLETDQILANATLPNMRESIELLKQERDEIQKVNDAYIEQQGAKQNASENVDVDVEANGTATGTFDFDFDEDTQSSFDAYSEAMFNKMVVDEVARQNEEENLRLRKEFIETYPEEAAQLNMLTDEQMKFNRLKKQLSEESKAFKIKETLMNTFEGANALYKGYVSTYPPPIGQILGAAAYVATIAKGKKDIQQIRKAQYGADFVTDGPQMMMVGEGSGPERVQVTPLVDENRDGPQGQGITLNISGNVLHDSFVEDSVVPQIREALRMGENLGA